MEPEFRPDYSGTDRVQRPDQFDAAPAFQRPGVPPPVVPELATFGQRVVASLISGAVGLVLGVPVFFTLLHSGSLAPLIVWQIVVLAFSVWLLHWNGTTGYTIGKRAIGIRVVDEVSYQPIGWGRAFIRALVLSVSGSFCGLPLIALAIMTNSDPRRQGWHDKAARSVVIQGHFVKALGASGSVPGAHAAVPPFVAPQSPVHPAAPHPTRISVPPPVPPLGALRGQIGAPPPAAEASKPPAAVDPVGRAESTPVAADSPILAETVMGRAHAPSVPPAPPAPSASPAPPAPPAPSASDVPAAPLPWRGAEKPGWLLVDEDGTSRHVTGVLLVGRDPEAVDSDLGAETWSIYDPARSMSKTHAAFGVIDGQLWVEDRHSTNGVSIRTATDERPVAVGEGTAVADGDVVVLGDHAVTVRWVGE